MFLALRDLRFATGRFALMGAVVALITVLLVMLSGLTAGLGRQNTAVLDGFGQDGVQRVVFGGTAGQDPAVSFTQSEFTDAQRQVWASTVGVAGVEPVGLSQGRVVGLASPAPEGPVQSAELDVAAVASAAFVGLAPGAAEAPAGLADGALVLSRSLAEQAGVAAGGRVEASGAVYTVAEVVDDSYYSHTPVAWATLHDWTALTHATDARVLGTAGLVRFEPGADVEAATAAADAAAHTVATDVPGSYAALPAYSSEHGSLTMMQGFLYGISALVVVAFLSIWTVQRTREIAVLKALGGSTGWVLRDALAQGGIVLALGVAVGTAVATAAGRFAAQAVPFVLDATTTVLPALGILALGLAGSALAVARVARIDPLIALGGN
ncbi:ABC transporter permease [Micrococcus sp.]|uniref:ABC transporter permease n=1 Tax=Micrococcus sp. TaxID=1271 RepID=UPI002A91168C|nr:ABC transporter permease [Micrococcus sp.]MDY6055278.1 ABC transporter permease [Micrococcus sp.]